MISPAIVIRFTAPDGSRFAPAAFADAIGRPVDFKLSRAGAELFDLAGVVLVSASVVDDGAAAVLTFAPPPAEVGR